MAEADRDEKCDELASELENYVLVMILTKGNNIEYVVPSFPVFAVELVEVKLQWEDGETAEVHVFDGFTRNCKEIDHPLPGKAKVYYSYKIAFIIEVSYDNC